MKNENIEQDQHVDEIEQGKNTSYFKVIAIFMLVMAALLYGVYYLFEKM